MKVYKITEGATYWVAAKSILEAFETIVSYHEETCTIDEFSCGGYVAFDEIPERKAKEVSVKMDDEEVPCRNLWDLAQSCTEPEVIACSEWP